MTVLRLAVFTILMALLGSTASAAVRLLATTSMIGDVAAEIGGPQVEVTTLMGPGIDPHLYTPTRDDLTKLLTADIVFYSGLKLEGRMGDVLTRFGRGKPTIPVGERIDQTRLLTGSDPHHPDPHIWMDVALWSEVAGVIGAELAQFDPPNAAVYTERTVAYRARLAELDRYAREVIATVPEQSRLLVTAHDAFHYMARAYNLEVQGIQGISTESEAGLKELNGLVDTVVERQVKAVFVESSVSEKNVRALVEGANARGAKLEIGGELFSDAMGLAGTWEGTYIGMIDHNATTIARALGGQVPEKGFRGWSASKGATP